MTSLLATLPLGAVPAAAGWLALTAAGAVLCEGAARAGQLRAGTGLALVGLQVAWVALCWGLA